MRTELFKLVKDIYKFYQYDCCWPYSLSFYLVLVIYWLEAVIIQNPSKWASIVSYTVILAYYLYLRKCLSAGTIFGKRNLSFFSVFLTSKIIIWGLLLLWITML